MLFRSSRSSPERSASRSRTGTQTSSRQSPSGFNVHPSAVVNDDGETSTRSPSICPSTVVVSSAMIVTGAIASGYGMGARVVALPSRAVDAHEFLGLRATHNPLRWYLEIVPGICTDGLFLFGGCGLGAAIEALESFVAPQGMIVLLRLEFVGHHFGDQLIDRKSVV